MPAVSGRGRHYRDGMAPVLDREDAQYREDNRSGQQRSGFGVAQFDVFHTDMTFC